MPTIPRLGNRGKELQTGDSPRRGRKILSQNKRGKLGELRGSGDT